MLALPLACRLQEHGKHLRDASLPSDSTDSARPATASTADTAATAEPVEPTAVCGHAVAPGLPTNGRRLAGIVDAEDLWWLASGGVAGETLGWNGAAGDFDGDGDVDLAVEHVLADYGISVFLGPLVPGVCAEPEVIAYAVVPTPSYAEFRFGFTDVDDDDDIALGDSFGSGVAYILRGGWE